MHHVLVVCAAVFVAFFNYGILQAYGSLFTDTLDKFGEGRSQTSLIFSLLAGTSLGGGVIAGYLIKRTKLVIVSTIGSVLFPLGFIISYFAKSVTFLLISIGIVSGLGVSFSYVSAVVVLGTVISEKHKTSALSLQNVACGVPGIVVPYLFAWLTKTFTLSGTFLIYGGITLNNLAASILFSGIKLKENGYKHSDKGDSVKENQPVNNNIDAQSREVATVTSTESNDAVCKQEPDLEDVRKGETSQITTYVLFSIGEVLAMTTVIGILALYQDIGVFKGLSTEQALSCISAYNIASTLSRFFPFVFQVVTENPFLSPIVATLSGVSGQIIILTTSNYYIILIGYVLSGMADGGTSASIAVVIYKILTQNTQTIGFGFVLTLMGIIGAASGPIYGTMFDQTESYSLALSVTSSCFAVSAVFFTACFISYRNMCCRITKHYIVNKD